MDEEELLQQFVLAADDFCSWLEGKEEMRGDDALRMIAALYNSALNIPNVDVVNLRDFDRIPELGQLELDRVRLRLAYFPFLYYWDMAQALAMDGQEPLLGEINDDIADIYKDVKEGLMAFENGLKDVASWHWRQTWALHWGRHAASAMRALHEHVTG